MKSKVRSMFKVKPPTLVVCYGVFNYSEKKLEIISCPCVRGFICLQHDGNVSKVVKIGMRRVVRIGALM